YLKIQPYRLKSLATRTNQNLNPHYYGPFEVLEKVGTVAYKLKLPAKSAVHPVFHVLLLKKCLAAGVLSQPLPNELIAEWELHVQPAAVLDVRTNPQGELEVLIQWQDMPNFESSWESAEDIKLAFPNFHLEDKVIVQGGIVRDQAPGGIKVYKRR